MIMMLPDTTGGACTLRHPHNKPGACSNQAARGGVCVGSGPRDDVCETWSGGRRHSWGKRAHCRHVRRPARRGSSASKRPRGGRLRAADGLLVPGQATPQEAGRRPTGPRLELEPGRSGDGQPKGS